MPDTGPFEELFCADGPVQPSLYNVIGSMDVRDSMHYEFDLEVHSFPTDSAWRDVLRVEGGRPSMFIDDGSNLIVNFVGSAGTVIDDSSYGDTLETGRTYHVVFQWDQHWFWGSIDDVAVKNESVSAHDVDSAQTIYCGYSRDPANVSISNLLIYASDEPFTSLRTAAPTANPTASPTAPTSDPTQMPTAEPTANPSRPPSRAPTRSPSVEPTVAPSGDPTASPSTDPTLTPSTAPSEDPTAVPSPSPSSGPTTRGNGCCALFVHLVAFEKVKCAPSRFVDGLRSDVVSDRRSDSESIAFSVDESHSGSHHEPD